jgi:hypothetical protein
MERSSSFPSHPSDLQNAICQMKMQLWPNDAMSQKFKNNDDD